MLYISHRVEYSHISLFSLKTRSKAIFSSKFSLFVVAQARSRIRKIARVLLIHEERLHFQTNRQYCLTTTTNAQTPAQQ